MQYLVSVIVVIAFLNIPGGKPNTMVIVMDQPQLAVQTVEKPVTVEAPAPEVKPERTTKQLISDTFGSEARVAYAVMMAESGGRTNATNKNTNGSTDRGLFQINSIHTKKVNGNLESLYNVETNVNVAKRIYDGSGWNAWSAYKNGSYKKYLSKY